MLKQYKQQIESLELVPAGGGCFELSVGDELVYSKLKTGKFPDETKLAETVGKRLAASPPA